jgi:hypothetical protein
MPRAGGPGGRVSLDFEADESPACQLSKEVDLQPALSLANVIEARSSFRDGDLGSELCHDERVEKPAEQVAVPHHQIDVETEHGGRDGWIDDVSLR